ncbi:MAG TPA: NADH:flavin oxidoreductase/NADH oxidase, partial [Nocardioides sp.]|uniref:oxidoreductase n=1 Tax=Nocardioides sp. TaxID=35761 RepID=UPI002CCC2069
MALLFTPVTLRGRTIRNRVWLSPMCQYAVDARDGVPTDWQLVHLGARAVGGFGLVLTEATAVLPEGRISVHDTGLWNDAQAEAWARIAAFVRARGAAVGVQLAHAGRKASVHRPFPGEPRGPRPVDDGGWQPVGPSTEAFPGLTVPHQLDHAEIGRTVAAFASAAGRALAAGFDVVEVHAGHGYLLHEFLSPLSNQRTDEYGGDLPGRSRLLVEVVDAIREVWPDDRPLLVRISGTDWVDGGWDVEQSTQLAGVLADHGWDLVDVSSGVNAPAQIP